MLGASSLDEKRAYLFAQDRPTESDSKGHLIAGKCGVPMELSSII
jgi:hypothetical protein